MKQKTSASKSQRDKPTIGEFIQRDLGPKPWGEELLIAHQANGTMKRLTMNAGEGGPLQYHIRKEESFFMQSGLAQVTYDDGQGVLETLTMTPGQTIHVPPGAVHQVNAIEDCVFYELSTPHFDDRVGVEQDYA